MTDPTLVRHTQDNHDDDDDDDVHNHQSHDHSPQQQGQPKNSRPKPLTDDWRSWLILNVARGCDRQELFDRCVVENGFDAADVLETLDRQDGATARTTTAGASNNTSSTAVKEEEKKDQTNKEDPKPKSGEKAPTQDNNKKTVNNGWKEWIRVRLDQGSTKEDVFLRCIQEGLNLDQVSQVLGGYRARTHEMDAFQTNDNTPPAFTKRTFTPRTWRLDTDLVEIYEIPKFLTKEECQEVIHAINTGMLQRSIVTDGNSAVRTSQTCHLRRSNDTRNGIIRRVEDKLQKLMGNDDKAVSHAEPLQGQCYSVGEYFQSHTDYFEPNSEEYDKHCRVGGQRTWTVMVYLNNVPEGGETKFVHLEREFLPRQGWGLAWNNLDADHVTPNPWTLHEAMPVLEGKKYVLTKWFREKSMV